MTIVPVLRATLVAALLLVGCASPVAGQSPPDEAEQIPALIKLLDADSFDERERASRELRAIGFPALAALEAAREHPSLEVRWRARAIAEGMTSGVRLKEWTAFAALPAERLDLEQGMWLIAKLLDPQVKQQAMTKPLDELADRVREKLGKGVDPASADPQVIVAAVRQVLFVEEGFGGNRQDYGNPGNSSLERVLKTKKGLPILLSHVVVAVSRRLKAPIVGVPASGRYIVKYDGSRAPAGFAREDIYLNPFEDGQIMTREDRLAEFPAHDPDVMVPPDSNREVLIRMLRNLTSALANRGETEKLEQAEELLDLLEAYGTKTESRQ